MSLCSCLFFGIYCRKFMVVILFFFLILFGDTCCSYIRNLSADYLQEVIVIQDINYCIELSKSNHWCFLWLYIFSLLWIYHRWVVIAILSIHIILHTFNTNIFLDSFFVWRSIHIINPVLNVFIYNSIIMICIHCFLHSYCKQITKIIFWSEKFLFLLGYYNYFHMVVFRIQLWLKSFHVHIFAFCLLLFYED